MKKNMRVTSSRKITEVPAVVIGVVAATIISVLLTAGLTSLIMNGMVSETAAGPYVFVIGMIASAIGCLIGMILMKGKYLIIAGSAALGYLAVLIGLGIVLYEGSFKNMLSTVVSVLLGGVIACLLVLKPLKKPKHTGRYRR